MGLWNRLVVDTAPKTTNYRYMATPPLRSPLDGIIDDELQEAARIVRCLREGE